MNLPISVCYVFKWDRAGEFDIRYAIGYKGAQDFRWDADYGLKYDENTVKEVVVIATDFNGKMKELIDR